MNNPVKKAVENYLNKSIHKKTSAQTRRKNAKPELEVLKQLKSWLCTQGVFAFRVESQAVYSQAAGIYLYGQTIAGCPDLLAINNLGNFLAIEVKAPGRRSTLREAQLDFLLNVISRNGFACVSDSAEHLSKLYQSWLACPFENRKPLLLADLPKKQPGIGAKPLFED